MRAFLNGAPSLEPRDPPERVVTVREAARAKLLVDEVMDRSQRMRDLAARQADHPRLHATTLVRLQLRSASGFPFQVAPEGEAVPEATIERIREAVGDRGWDELAADRLRRR